MWKLFRSQCLDFHQHFQVLWLTPLIRCRFKVLLEKAIQSLRLSWHCQILALFLLRNFGFFIAPDGITDFDISQAKHCNLVFCSFVLRIDWLKPFLTDHAITSCVNGLNNFICLWCHTTIVTIRRKVRFHHTLPYPLWRNKGAVRLRLPRDFTRNLGSLIPVLPLVPRLVIFHQI